MTDDLDDDYGERLVGRLPVRVRRRVLWGECDPAQVVYTPRFADYLVVAFGWFSRIVLDAEAPTLADAGVGTPAKGLELTFHRVLRPNQIFEMTVLVRAVREHTCDLTIVARDMEDRLVFEGRVSPIFIDRGTFGSIAIPSAFRARLEQYRAACAPVADDDEGQQ